MFPVTHPFHPRSGPPFPRVAQRLAWGEPRVCCHDLATGRLRSLPTAWTTLAPLDPFVVRAAGRALRRCTAWPTLTRLLHDVEATLRAVPPCCPSR